MSRNTATQSSPQPLRTGFYGRVTAEESLRKDLSLPNQVARYTELAEEQGWEPHLFVESQAVSGELGPEDRPALSELIAAVEAGALDAVVVRHLDRLGRGPVLEGLIDAMRASRVRLFTFDGEQDIRSAAGRLAIRAQSMVGAFEVERTGERIREMHRQKARAGVYIGPTPFGYQSQARFKRELLERLGEGEDAERTATEQAQQRYPLTSHLYIDEAEAEVVREVYRIYVQGKVGGRRIALRLNERGWRSRTGVRWCGSKVLKLLKDPKVAGWVTYDEEAYRDGVKHHKPIWEQTRYEGRHEAIIDRETWERAQEVRRGRGRAVTPSNRPSRVFPLTHHIVCAEGHPMRSKDNGEGCHRYVCGQRHRLGPRPEQGGCDADTVDAVFAEGAVRQVLSRVLDQPAQVQRVMQAAVEASRHLPKFQPKTTPTDDLESQLKRLEGARERWYRMLEESEAGSREEGLALDRLEQLRGQLATVEADLAEARRKVIPLPARITEAKVRRFLGRLTPKLRSKLGALDELVDLMSQEHGLAIRAVEDGCVEVSLALDVEAAVGIEGAERARLSATVRAREEETAPAWARRLNAEGGPVCACGCGEALEIVARHKWQGVPRFLPGHQKMAMTAVVEDLNAEGWLTVGQAATLAGCGATTLRRMADRGEIAVEHRSWKRRAPMRCFRREDIEALREELAQQLTDAEAAEALGLSVHQLRYRVRAGKLERPEGGWTREGVAAERG